MRTLTAAPPRATGTKTNEPRPQTGTSTSHGTTTAKARYALMRQALEAARSKSTAPERPDGEALLLDFLRST